ncbi:variable large family protein (plasmid) [Borrelia coriaceae]|nr:variable large family protein [Borrelia coriaceae]
MAADNNNLVNLLDKVGEAFYSFLDLVAGSMGFIVTKDTPKSEVGKHFEKLAKGLEKASGKLDEVANKATGIDKSDSSKNLIKEAVKEAQEVLGKLKTHLESLKDIGGDSENVGVSVSQKQGVASDGPELKKAYNALKGIVDVAGKEGVSNPKAGEMLLKVGNGTDNKDGAKILATKDAPGAVVADKAAAILSTVNGAEMLESIVKSEEKDIKELAGNASDSTTPLEFAKGGQASQLAHTDKTKAAAVAGGIALRSLVKGGKLAGHNNDDDKVAQLVGISAVNKLLGAVEDIIKKTVKHVLGTAKQKIDDARAPKPAVSEASK